MFQRTFSRWAALTALLLLAWLCRDVLSPFVIGAILAYVLSPLVDLLRERTRIHRRWIALGTVLVLMTALGVLLWFAGDRLGREVRAFSSPNSDVAVALIDSLTGGTPIDLFGRPVSSEALAAQLTGAINADLGTSNLALRTVTLLINGLLNILLVFVTLAYLLVDGRRFGSFWLRFVPAEHRPRVSMVQDRINNVLTRYLRGQLVLVCLMSFATFLILEFVFHLEYALWLSVLTGLLEVVPLLGPFAAGALACAVALTEGGMPEAAAVAVAYFVLRQVEDQLVMPVVVGRAVHVHPLLTIFAVLVGERTAGILGMVIAVPLAAAIKVVLDYGYPPEESPIILPSPQPVSASRTLRAEPLGSEG